MMCCFAWLGGTSWSSAGAATLPAGFSETLIASGLSNPASMAFAPDGRLFVCERDGKLRVIKNGALLSTPFVTLPVTFGGATGLLSVTFDPNFNTNRYLYVQYTTASSPVHNRVSRFTANGDIAVSDSEVVIFDVDSAPLVDHFGGPLGFRADGKLYIATGDNRTSSNSQSLGNLQGKILRINSNGTIPTDNPFYNSATGKNRAIWALGLRNPFTFATQPGTDRFFINDVGESAWEEIDEGFPGSNYGWPNNEGPTNNTAFRAPIYAYGRNDGCAITGGAFYNPTTSQFPATYKGKYFYADYCNGYIRVLDPSTKAVSGFATGISAPIDIKIGADGSLYYLALSSNSIYKVTSTSIPISPPSAPANLRDVSGNSQITLSWTGSSNATSYNLKRSSTSGGPYQTIISTSSTSYTDSGLTNGTRYYYIVTAVGNGGESSASNETSGAPTGPSPTPTPTPTPKYPPAAPTNLRDVSGNSQITLSWTGNQNATGYNLKRSSTAGGSYQIIASISNTSYVDSGLTNGTRYYYIVTAYGSGGESGPSNGTDGAPNGTTPTPTPTYPPSAPANLRDVSGNSQITLSWTGSSNATSYNLKRSSTSGGPFQTVASTSNTSYTDTGLTNGTRYYYIVTAVGNGGESSPSNGTDGAPNGTTPAPTPKYPPAAPTNLRDVSGNSQITLSWTGSSNATSYNLKRSSTPGGSYQTIVSTSNTGYIDTGLTKGIRYYYIVTAVGSGGESGASNGTDGAPTG